MGTEIPQIDPRRAVDIAAQVHDLLKIYAPEIQMSNSATGHPVGVSGALVGVFARYAELIIERLNRVPEKNLLAFLDLIGASPLPPEPASVPLTFFLATGTTTDAVVPVGTQVAAAPSAGESAPVIFETQRNLVVSAATLTALFVRDPMADRYADRSALTTLTATEALPIFAGENAIEHMLYIGHASLLAQPVIEELRLRVELLQDIKSADPRRLRWELWDGIAGIALDVVSDTTADLTKSGTVVFNRVSGCTEQIVNQRRNRWLRCRLLTPIALNRDQQAGRVRSVQLPSIKIVRLQAVLKRLGLRCKSLFANTQALNQQQEFLPFGAVPKFGDTFYIACGDTISVAPSEVTLKFSLTQFTSVTATPTTLQAIKKDLALSWELWEGQRWLAIEPSDDTTDRLTKSGVVTLKLSTPAKEATINGVKDFWLRVRISKGDYGKEARFELQPSDQKVISIASTLAPPFASEFTIDYQATLAETTPDLMLAYNDFAYTTLPVDNTFVPFQAGLDQRPTFYCGFELPPQRPRFAKHPISFYLHTPSLAYGHRPDNPAAQSPPRLRWEYWNGTDWKPLSVRDETDTLTRSGSVEFLPPTDFSPSVEFSLSRYWLRVVWTEGEYIYLPTLDRVLLNSVVAMQTVTFTDDVVGSSDGSKNQGFRATHTPMLSGQTLEVRETAADVIQAWVPWQEVSDFHASEPSDRHYVLDRLSGTIQFGDGLNGRIPPIGASNIRLRRYRIGGGRAGNKPVGTVVQLQSTLAFIDRVTNVFPASGGAEAETPEAFLARAPRTARHLNNAVTLEDFEDLALAASPDVVRARAVGLVNLERDPDGNDKQVGSVSVVVVPSLDVPKPIPDLALLSKVEAYLNARCSPLVDLVVVGPDYIRVDIEVDITPVSLDATIDLEVRLNEVLNRFLHPITGGLDGRGWNFGRKPHRSDLYVVLEREPGVDHIRGLKVIETEDRLGASNTGRFLVYAGTHQISLSTFEVT